MVCPKPYFVPGRPGVSGTCLSWGSRKRNYDTALFRDGVKQFLSIGANYFTNENWLIDAVDFSRQVISNKGDVLYNALEQSFRQKNVDRFKKNADAFLHLILLEDSLLSLHKAFSLNQWLDAARKQGRTHKEKALFEWNAKTLITYWGSNDPETDLHDYANREMSGLLRSFYYRRWELFMDYCIKEMNGEPVSPPDFFTFEKSWASDSSHTSPIRFSGKERNALWSRLQACL
ncbi:alpha-N-acetylglucosaminidase C-terminal domain-containing protein [Niabella sp. CC-SYL272]|uniref:alpha-N-acetylglucosaminidase C-terminal domain-containing protein n=1 Tax=Niabella agricola TaxID=2891571 RepID=UPI001F2C7DEA|nr:alpha-N-acetylglucosaminidase C-terminal domain-containing protein [Niabella agricola]MCF3108670.1 alpha-N-acetylglucosaminidase C-terminal domain-containing protein [Niabella agricola]